MYYYSFYIFSQHHIIFSAPILSLLIYFVKFRLSAGGGTKVTAKALKLSSDAVRGGAASDVVIQLIYIISTNGVLLQIFLRADYLARFFVAAIIAMAASEIVTNARGELSPVFGFSGIFSLKKLTSVDA